MLDNVVYTCLRGKLCNKHITYGLPWQQCEILEKLGTSLYLRHTTCTAMLAQQNSICLINLDSFVGVTVLYSAAMSKDIFGVLGTR